MKTRSTILLLTAFLSLSGPQFLIDSPAAQPGDEAHEKELCTQNLKLVYEAIQAYRRDYKDLPNWLSDLVPKYIADTNSLVCPVARRTGEQNLFGISDPKVKTSYVFEFCAQKVPGVISGGGELTMREFKRLQMALVGGETPVLRCHLHPRVLNIGFDGKLYQSETDWEQRFQDVVHLDELESPSTIVARVVTQIKQQLAEGERFRLELQDAQRAARTGRMDEFKTHFHTLLKDFSDRPEIYGVVLSAALDSPPEQARKLAQEVINAKAAPDSAKEFAQGLIRKADAVGKPLDLSFTALDGREVDLSRMKGKVVLLDFWATWCGPCVAELPNVKAAYDKLHAKGFEIVGISFDNSKDALTKFVSEKGMAWPQYFDGKGWQNKFGEQYGIHSIPTMWLVDKKGVLRDLNPRGLLEEKVEQLLADDGNENSSHPQNLGDGQ